MVGLLLPGKPIKFRKMKDSALDPSLDHSPSDRAADTTVRSGLSHYFISHQSRSKWGEGRISLRPPNFAKISLGASPNDLATSPSEWSCVLTRGCEQERLKSDSFLFSPNLKTLTSRAQTGSPLAASRSTWIRNSSHPCYESRHRAIRWTGSR